MTFFLESRSRAFDLNNAFLIIKIPHSPRPFVQGTAGRSEFGSTNPGRS